MRRSCILSAVAAVLLAASPALGSAPERFEDAVGDTVGDAPDIVAVTVSEGEGSSTVRFEIELVPERPFGTDMETWTDVLFIFMSEVADVDERGIMSSDGYITGTHGVTLDHQCDVGAMLVTPEGMYEHVVDVEAVDDTIAFTFDRKLMGSPLDLYFQVLLGVERDLSGWDEEEGEDEGDTYPEIGEPPAHYRLGVPDW